jgi:hypothetical protein
VLMLPPSSSRTCVPGQAPNALRVEIVLREERPRSVRASAIGTRPE